MVFSSLSFLLLFLPLLLILYFVIPNLRWKNAVLLVFSLVFYAWGEPVWIVCMLGATLVNWAVAFWIGRAKTAAAKRWILAIGVVASLAALFWFKYAGFFLTNFYALFHIPAEAPSIRLPIGISFYTFQILTYTVDVYRGKVPPQKSFFRLLLYVSCFPQLIAGPIVQYGDIAEQLEARTTHLVDFSEGMGRFAVGLGKKVLLANLCGKAVETLLPGGAALSVAGAWMSAVLYALQIYFDFSAYSDMAIGLGRVFGFRYRENFNYPYLSGSISEFWRRWHISLGSFFREYVYIPLGGNRKGALATARNLLIVWVLTGFWHGAEWNFLAWGLYYGVWILLERFVLQKLLERIPRWLRVLPTLLVVLIGWILFYHVSLAEGWRHIGALVGAGGLPLLDETALSVLHEYTVLPLIAVFCCLPIVPKCKAWMENRPALQRIASVAVPVLQTLLFAASIAMLVGQSYNPFIYFRF